MLDEDDFWDQLNSSVSSSGSVSYTLSRSKSCIGKRVLVYDLQKSINRDFFSCFTITGDLSFPLGENYPYYQFAIPGMFVITGLLGDREIKAVPRVKASLPEVCQLIANALDQFCHQRE